MVSPSGDDAASGSAAAPWRTISHAARVAPAGSLVDIRGGEYRERVVFRVSGNPGRPTTFAAHPGERVAISGRGVRVPNESGLVHIDGRSHIELVGLEIRDARGSGRRSLAGVWIKGSARSVGLHRLNVHRITTRDGNAHGIAVYGTSGAAPATDVAIEQNHVHDLRLGASEAVVVNGNVDGWRIVGNRIEDVNNIAVDAIGYEGVAPRNDQARNGLIASNVIRDVDTAGNRAYREEGGNCRCAGGIYVDGGRSIVIERNVVTRANLGIELASEARRGNTSDVLVRNNFVSRSDRAGLTMGGYDRRRGKTVRVRVVNNAFVDGDQLRTGVGEVELNYRLSDSLVVNNVFRARPRGVLVTNGFKENFRNVFDGNVWFSPGRTEQSAVWHWRTRRLRGFAAWRRATGGDNAGRYANPLLTTDGRPAAGSPLIDAGVPTPLAGDVDLAGAPRRQGAAIDAGAFESG